MTVSLRVMTAGNGYRYLTSQVAAGDGRRELGTPLVRYYAESGTPPGWWTGSGLPGLADASIRESAEVTEEQMRRLVGNGEHPSTGEPLGRRYFKPVAKADRIEARVRALRPGMGRAERRKAIAAIRAQEEGRKQHHAVAGFDLTFSVPKSVSVLWGLTDAGTQALIVEAHHEAIRDVLAMVERDVAATRSGVHGVVHEDVQGVLAMCFDHFDSRAGDPQLHTHVVIVNRVQTAAGAWQTLDSRTLHRAIVGLSEHYGGLLADRLTRTFGVGWQARARGRDRNPSWEIETVPEVLIGEFSSRSMQIEVEKDRLIAEYVATHGRKPSPRTVIRLRQQATLATRPAKESRSLKELTDGWRQRGHDVLGKDPLAWARQVTAKDSRMGWRADDVPLTAIGNLGGRVVEAVSQKRSTWRHWNLIAEASRQLMASRFASATDREQVLSAVVAAAERASVRLTPGESAVTPARFRRPDGSTRFRPRDQIVYSSVTIMEAEERLLALTRDLRGPTCGELDDPPGGVILDQGQRDAIGLIARSGRRLDLLVGPAGAGKTTTLAALKAWWEQAHGTGSVIGLAPSASAADVLAGELKIGCENTAKWRHEHARGHWRFRAGQLVIVDEASLAGTLTLDEIASAATVGAKVLLVGDWAQLCAVDAGGAFGMLAKEYGKVPELTDVRRFTHEWEKTATIQLRVGELAALDAYEQHDRIHGGEAETMTDAAYRAWQRDRKDGKASILIAADGATVSRLNARARLDRQAAGDVEAGGVRLSDGNDAGRGDLVITRRNDRRLVTGSSWVKNGDRWQVLARHDDGSLTVRRSEGSRAGTLTLPAGYVSEHVDLGYAITVHRAQGTTVGTAHAVISAGIGREALYVAMTRGRHANRAYVSTSTDETERHHATARAGTARDVLAAILTRTGSEASARATADAEQATWASRRQLMDECQAIERAAEHDLAVGIIEGSRLRADLADQVLTSPRLPELIDAMRRAAELGHQPARMLRVHAQTMRPADDTDPAAHLADAFTCVLDRDGRPAGAPPPRRAPMLRQTALGLIPADLAQALEERRRLIQAMPLEPEPTPSAPPVRQL